jgi:hypothetical protein
MLKKTLIASAIAAVSFGSLAAAPKVATEVFGAKPGDVVISSGLAASMEFGPADGTVGTGAVGKVTYTLTNGTFASNVLISDLTPTGGLDVSIDTYENGKIGDSSVTFQVTTNAAIIASGTLDLNIEQIKAPALAQTGKHVVATVTSVPVNNVTGGAIPAKTATNSVVESLDFLKLTTSVATGNNGEISADDNTKFVDGTFKIADLTVATDGGPNLIVYNDGNPVELSDFNGKSVSITGAFNEGDVVKFGPQELTVDADAGTATGTITGDLTEGSDLVVYTPKGDENLTPTAFETVFSATPSVSSWETKTATQKSETTFNGQEFEAKVYAVPDSSKSDIANIRVSNTAGSMNKMFVQVIAENGTMSTTVQLDPLAVNETVRFQAKDIEDLTGFEWDGRATLVFSGQKEFSVTTMLRTSNGSLTNASSATDAKTN